MCVSTPRMYLQRRYFLVPDKTWFQFQYIFLYYHTTFIVVSQACAGAHIYGSTFSRKFKRKLFWPGGSEWVERPRWVTSCQSTIANILDTCQGSILLLSWTPFKESGTRLSYDNDDTKRDLSSKLLAQRPPRMAKKATNLIQYRTAHKIWILHWSLGSDFLSKHC